MFEIIRLVFISIAFSVLYIVPGILVSIWFVKIGVIQHDERWIIIICGLFVGALTTVLSINESRWGWVIPFMFMLIIGSHRYQLSQAMKRGRWWWKKKGDLANGEP
jgi:hypothetical protein